MLHCILQPLQGQHHALFTDGPHRVPSPVLPAGKKCGTGRAPEPSVCSRDLQGCSLALEQGKFRVTPRSPSPGGPEVEQKIFQKKPAKK